MSKQLAVGKWNFQTIRVYVQSIQKDLFIYVLNCSVATLLLRNACRFFGGKIAKNGQYGLDIAL